MRGGSCIIRPLGQMLAERVFDRDALLTAEIDPGEVARCKYDFDVTGHYARSDVFRLMVNETSQSAVQKFPEAPSVVPTCSQGLARPSRARKQPQASRISSSPGTLLDVVSIYC